MVRILQTLLLFSLLFATSLEAQVSVVEGQDFEIEGQTSQIEITAYVEIDFGADQVGEWLWELERDEDIPSEWSFSICDNNLCYLPGTYVCPENNPNIVDPSTRLKMEVHLYPNGVEGGIHNTTLKLFSADDNSVILVSPQLTWDIQLASSVEDTNINQDYSLFPNPTSDYFNIDNDSNIAQVSVYTILGKEMFTYDHEEGQAYSVADLEEGFYFARLIGYDGKSLKVLRFNKNSKN